MEMRHYIQSPVFNDQKRSDGYKNAICLSISFPNYQMFYKYSAENQADWAILLLKPAVLWELDCAYCQENAASKAVLPIPLEDRRNPDALRKMFSDYGNVSRQSLNIPNNYPTHPQAEVLVFDAISPEYIQSVHFYDLRTLEQWRSSHQTIYSQKLNYNQQYFVPRVDWAIWKSAKGDGSDYFNTFIEDKIPF